MKRLNSLDQDQCEVLVSTGLFAVFVLVAAPFCSVAELFAFVPMQFLATYLLARRRPVEYKGKTFRDPASNKTWDAAISTAFAQSGFALTLIFAMLAFAHQHNSKPLAVAMLLLPLLLTRSVLFMRRLPLAALYHKDLLGV